MKLRLISSVILIHITVCFLLISILSASDEKVVAHNGTFSLYENGVVYDKKTELEWIAGKERQTSRKIFRRDESHQY